MQLSCAVPLAFLDRDGLMRGQADALIKRGIGYIASAPPDVRTDHLAPIKLAG